MNDKLSQLRAGKRNLILPILYMGCIFMLSSIPMGENIPGRYDLIKQIIHNLAHIPIFGILAFLWIRTFDKNRIQLKKAFLYTVVITVFYAVLDEFHQLFVLGRDASVGDIFLDITGCLVGMYAYWVNIKQKVREY